MLKDVDGKTIKEILDEVSSIDEIPVRVKLLSEILGKFIELMQENNICTIEEMVLRQMFDDFLRLKNDKLIEFSSGFKDDKIN